LRPGEIKARAAKLNLSAAELARRSGYRPWQIARFLRKQTGLIKVAERLSAVIYAAEAEMAAHLQQLAPGTVPELDELARITTAPAAAEAA
jgi:hypothetical protein